MFTSLTIILITVSAAILGGVEGWFWFRNTRHKILLQDNNEKEVVLMQVNHDYTALNKKFNDLQENYTLLQMTQRVEELKNEKLFDELLTLKNLNVALSNEFETYKTNIVGKTSELESSIKNAHTDFESKYIALKKDYDSAVADRKALHAAVSNLANDKQILMTEYGNFRSEANRKYISLKLHLDKLQNPYMAYMDAEEQKFDKIEILDTEFDTPETIERVSENLHEITGKENTSEMTMPAKPEQTSTAANSNETDTEIDRTYDAIKIIDSFEYVEESRDNLEKIEGIGPKIAEILNRNGIETFSQLADTNVQRLRDILHVAGSRFRMHDPASWATQSGLARDGNWDALNALQNKLKGGRE